MNVIQIVPGVIAQSSGPAIALTELLEAMYKSDKEGKTVVVD